MLAEIDREYITFGRLEGPLDGASIDAVVLFVEKHLVEFSNKYTGSSINDEDGLTQEFCILLNFYALKQFQPFFFQRDYRQNQRKGNSSRVDIGVINANCFSCSGSTNSFFSMEAKRLTNLPKPREKEYLVGHEEKAKGKYKECGGVERFKKEIHGKGLKRAAIIGYVQVNDFDYWHNTINSWIDQLIDGKIPTSAQWSQEDKLVEEYKRPNTAKFKSRNSRKTGSILLFHLWVNLV